MFAMVKNNKKEGGGVGKGDGAGGCNMVLM